MVIEQSYSHGKLKLDIRESIVFIEVTGPFNLEFFQAMEHQLFALRRQLNLWNYSALVTFKEDVLFTSDGLEFFSEYLKRVSPTAIAINLEHVVLSIAIKELLKTVHSKARANYYFFHCQNDAKVWLQSCMRRKKALNRMKA